MSIAILSTPYLKSPVKDGMSLLEFVQDFRSLEDFGNLNLLSDTNKIQLNASPKSFMAK